MTPTVRLVSDLVVLCFFQAEDGIRDIGVTGVQTCALPIYRRRPRLPGGARPHEKRELQARLTRHRAHLEDLCVRQQHYPRTLRDPVELHLAPLRLLEHGLEHPWSLDAGDLDAVLGAIRETLPRIWQPRQVAGGQTQLREQLVSLHREPPEETVGPISRWTNRALVRTYSIENLRSLRIIAVKALPPGSKRLCVDSPVRLISEDKGLNQPRALGL